MVKRVPALREDPGQFLGPMLGCLSFQLQVIQYSLLEDLGIGCMCTYIIKHQILKRISQQQRRKQRWRDGSTIESTVILAEDLGLVPSPQSGSQPSLTQVQVIWCQPLASE